MTHKASIIFYLQAIFFFFIDLCFLSFFAKPILYSLLCFYFLYLFNNTAVLARVIFCLFFLCLQSFIIQGSIEPALIFLTIGTLIALRSKQILNFPRLLPYLFVSCYLGFQTLLFEGQMGSMIATYTGLQIFVNIIVVFGLSLK